MKSRRLRAALAYRVSKPGGVWCWWLTPVILATQEAESRRIMVRIQLGQIVHETLS
jgi:hypothetical protein